MTPDQALAPIKARYDAAQEALANDQRLVSIRQLYRLSESANDVPRLLAAIEAVKKVADAWEAAYRQDGTGSGHRVASRIRAALSEALGGGE